jgi:FKBP12-rapamycin complex-associated protein
MARELFAAGFVSCWAELDPASQEQLVRSLEAALASPTIPPGIPISHFRSITQHALVFL